ncbi:uncharacterized protein LOC103517165 [Diaphorina citri]|uniref:Uncharacterized protein LOC103517165 n=1 Tax=Diaphorina citri TaxID=121845 RepID=A0A1S3DGB2_DIACI|nr:uncharacterized protein LOC103517165 [Diaphorina citri]KAI5713815.1 hypothetical protein M8J76_005977 [Diaphorina citri]KAI5716034.1 hypothetical protein M8J77_026373 [Diaphorina citri]
MMSSGKLLLFTIVMVTISLNQAARKIPSYIPKCKADDPQLEKCILDGVEKVRPHLANGIREINVPPVEPFAIDKLQVDRNNNNLKMKLVLTHMKAYGCSTFKINTFKVTKDGAEGTITFPTLNVTADFDINGSVFNQKMKGTGIFSANLKNVKVNVNMKVKTIDNGKYVQMKDMHFKIVNKSLGSNSDVKLLPSPNAQGKDAKMLKDALRFFNDNREQVYELALPIVEETGREIVLNIGNNVLKAIPIQDVVA